MPRFNPSNRYTARFEEVFKSPRRIISGIVYCEPVGALRCASRDLAIETDYPLSGQTFDPHGPFTLFGGRSKLIVERKILVASSP